MTPDPIIYGVPRLRWRWSRLGLWWGRPTYTEPVSGRFCRDGWEWLGRNEGAREGSLWPLLLPLSCLSAWGLAYWLLLT